MKIAIIGRSRYLYNAIKPLQESNHEICAIVTGKESPGYDITARDYRELALSKGIQFMYTDRINGEQSIDWIRDQGADIAISMNWRTIIQKECRSLFKHGIINIHLGDLPRYRGNATPNWALLNGEDKVVLTIHLMDDGLDSGPILLKHDIPIHETTYIGDIYKIAEQVIPNLLTQSISGLESGELMPVAQPTDPLLSLRCYPRSPRDSEIDWNNNAENICRLVRASAEPFAGAFTYSDNEKIIIWKARAVKPAFQFLGLPGQVAGICRDSGEVTVICGEDFLVIEEIGNSEGVRLRADYLIKSTRCRLGMDVYKELSRLNKLLKEQSGGDKTAANNRMCYQL